MKAIKGSFVITGARVVTPGRDLGVTPVRVEAGRIAAVGADVAKKEGDGLVEADGLTLLPGFVDIHSHGRGGADFCDATDDAFDTIGRGKLKDGVTGFLATGLTRPEEELAELCSCAERYKKRAEGSSCLGVHLEGPFFNADMAGAQNPAYLRKPDAAFVKRLDSVSPVKKVSLAPELDGAEECIRELTAAGIVTSGGHSTADYDAFETARAAGMTHLTHFCNAMMPIHHLRPTMVTGGLLADDVYVEIITDGVHLSDPMIRLISRAKGPGRVMIITDAMCAAGEPDGMYSLGGLRVKVERGRATLADVPYDPKAVVSNVAGSVALFPDCFRRFVRVAGWPLHEAVKAAGYNQLRSLGIMDRGEIAPGQVADLVLLDGSLTPRITVSGGNIKTSIET
ncbi:MAG: N-acetylglucosamine-6-phosphate deacetylase [Kiritimatiellae bacterium]|nr:N-acetylglucosamine-6-phosphate deacetylase [Kiritimatiellia bacterium]